MVESHEAEASRGPVRRDGQRGNGRVMDLLQGNRACAPAARPDGDAAILAAGGETPVGQHRHGIDRAVMRPEDGARDAILERPQNG